VWSKNTIFGVYSEKFRKVPILQQRLDLNPAPHGEAAADIAKMFEQNLQENWNSSKNDFRKLPQTSDFCCLYMSMYVYLKKLFAVIICKYPIFIDVIHMYIC
jgi:hypothetical protein